MPRKKIEREFPQDSNPEPIEPAPADEPVALLDDEELKKTASTDAAALEEALNELEEAMPTAAETENSTDPQEQLDQSIKHERRWWSWRPWGRGGRLWRGARRTGPYAQNVLGVGGFTARSGVSALWNVVKEEAVMLWDKFGGDFLKDFLYGFKRGWKAVFRSREK